MSTLLHFLLKFDTTSKIRFANFKDEVPLTFEPNELINTDKSKAISDFRES